MHKGNGRRKHNKLKLKQNPHELQQGGQQGGSCSSENIQFDY